MTRVQAFLILLLALMPGRALADTVISSSISTDTTWSPAGGVYIINSIFSVQSGATLTIEPGTIIKARTISQGGPSIYGHLIAHGTNAEPIIFTSIYDDRAGGDSGGDGPTESLPGEWQGLYFKPGSTGDLDHVIIRYAGYGGFGFGNFVGIENDRGT